MVNVDSMVDRQQNTYIDLQNSNETRDFRYIYVVALSMNSKLQRIGHN